MFLIFGFVYVRIVGGMLWACHSLNLQSNHSYENISSIPFWWLFQNIQNPVLTIEIPAILMVGDENQLYPHFRSSKLVFEIFIKLIRKVLRYALWNCTHFLNWSTNKEKTTSFASELMPIIYGFDYVCIDFRGNPTRHFST